jgi:hypothetical protein
MEIAKCPVAPGANETFGLLGFLSQVFDGGPLLPETGVFTQAPPLPQSGGGTTAVQKPPAEERAAGSGESLRRKSAAGSGLLGFLPSFLMALRYFPKPGVFTQVPPLPQKAVETTFQGDNKPSAWVKRCSTAIARSWLESPLPSSARERPSGGTRSGKLPTRTHRSDELLCGPFS